MLHTHKVAGSNPAGNSIFLLDVSCEMHNEIIHPFSYLGFYGVMVSTLDFESSDPSSNLGGTLYPLTPWRNGSASDSRSEGCVFKSRRGHCDFVIIVICVASSPNLDQTV